MARDIVVLKFGSSVLRTAADLPAAVHEIYSWYRRGARVIAIVSAIGNTTEALLSEARALTDEPEPHAAAELLATGERHSAALMGIALNRAGVAARVVDPREIALHTQGSALDSELVSVDRERLSALVDEFAVLVVPGFFGYGEDERLRLLGRGGSDLTAVYLANVLGAQRCRLIKDVDGVYERDPAETAATPLQRFVTLGYDEAVERATQLIQPKAVRFLERHSRNAEVAALSRPYETVVGKVERALTAVVKPRPLSVLILGLGTVGLGVYRRLTSLPDHFRVIGVLVRDRAKHANEGVPSELLHQSQDELVRLQPDIVVDALPGLQPSLALAHYYLAHGVHVVSANKAVIAEAGSELIPLAARNDLSLHYSAAVGGGAPMIEAVRRSAATAQIQSIEGVLNGTCNYVLDRCAEGLSLDQAVRAAQECGFAEADPSDDLRGRDAARKLSILAQQAFGQALSLSEISTEALDGDLLARLQPTLGKNETLRVIASARQVDGKIVGKVKLVPVALDDAFARTRNEWNRLRITHKGGRQSLVYGRGAGRWPTAEAVVADLLEIHSARSYRAA